MKIYKILLFALLVLPLSIFSQDKVNDTIVKEKPENGFVAEAMRKNNKGVSESMSTIGG